MLTEKFEIEIKKFFEWASETNYVLKLKDTIPQDWSLELVKKFKEPARNKLESFIKYLMDSHSINSGESKITDAKLMVKNFKNKKEKKVESGILNAVRVSGQGKAKVEKVKKEVKEKKETNKVKAKVEEKEAKVKDEIVIDMDINTDDTFYLCEIKESIKKNELMEVLGCAPEKTGEDDDNHQYEWKFYFNKNKYSIYNWAWEDGTFDDINDTQWLLAGNKKDSESIDKILAKLNGKPRDTYPDSSDGLDWD